ncbi:hypothetical protein [Enterococcus durans]|uniref:hypothetical protein n=1 Tax=Enterococcus durans TaxID=53345 RepID=UPI0009BECF6F|nr:hypothetical protein [Enterococcus durans]ASV95728.1 hypothetical protein CJZ72_09230 [Enterococcus durans]MCB8505803.1 hypothetical protein [Enterococcus durans]MCB8516744.1 hypothetical protein [Enterococcus durans]OQO80072.1 hypothetical protein BH742_10180 [Enterococcus durans]TVT00918.1 hypothetical protein FNV40_11415 [Enterococcus durans]
MLVQTNTHTNLSMIKKILETVDKTIPTKLLIVSVGDFKERGQIYEFYGNNLKVIWNNLLTAYRINQFEKAPYLRLDIVTNEESADYHQVNERLKKIKRNNYVDFNLRIDGLRKRSFLKEELVANAIIKPSKTHKVGKNLPDLHIDPQNYRGYIKRKYGREETDLSYLERSKFYFFETASFYLEQGNIYPLKNYGNGNRVREVTYDNLEETTRLVIEQGSMYLKKQLTKSGQFIYGYYPCYNQLLKGYNSVRHFSSLYALAEAAEYSYDPNMLQNIKNGLLWGIDNLTSEVDGYLLIKDYLNKEIEYKLGAQATAILAIAKYIEVTGDQQFYKYLSRLIETVSKKFITSNSKTIHVLDADLNVKEQFRIIYYDGEILFSLLRAYGISHDFAIFEICEGLMERFVTDGYQKYHDHWLSYATNEMINYQEKDTYYEFGIKNAMVNIDFIDKRDTAYPTMLELLVAASKMMKKLETSESRERLFKTEEEFIAIQDRINTVMEKRVLHEITTGVMFPEFAQFFKKPEVINYGFFARHDRFRMRIDDAEHFLSGLINYLIHYK